MSFKMYAMHFPFLCSIYIIWHIKFDGKLILIQLYQKELYRHNITYMPQQEQNI